MTTILEKLESAADAFAANGYVEGAGREAFLSGASTLLALLSESVEGHGPRVWLVYSPGVSPPGTDRIGSYCAKSKAEANEYYLVGNDSRSVEYCAVSEHLATRAGDLKRIEELEKQPLAVLYNSAMHTLTAEREKTTKLRKSLTRLGTAISMGSSQEIKKAALASSQALKESE